MSSDITGHSSVDDFDWNYVKKHDNPFKDVDIGEKGGLMTDIVQFTPSNCSQNLTGGKTKKIHPLKYCEVSHAVQLLGDKVEHQLNLSLVGQDRQRQISDIRKLGKNQMRQLVNHLIAGECECDFRKFRCRDEKIALLDAALDAYDGDVIIEVIIFLRRTLAERIFVQEMLVKPVAAEHYVDYLKLTGKNKECVDFLSMLGRQEEAAIFNYQLTFKHANIESRIKQLKHCQSHFFRDLQDEIWSNLIDEQISLYERQLPIDAADCRLQNGRQRLDQVSPFVGGNLISTLLYCCSFHYELSENNLASPLAIKKQHRLSEKQFVWTAFRALVATKNWDKIDSLFQYQTFLRSKKVKQIIPFEKVTQALIESKAPPELARNYLRFIENQETRAKLSQQLYS